MLLVLGRAGADVGLSLAAILFLVHSAGTGDWGWVRRPWFRVAFVLWLWLLFTSNFAFAVASAYSQAGTWMRFLVFAAAAEHWLLDERWMRRLLVVTSVTVLFVAADAVLQYLSGFDVFMHPWFNPYRLTGPFNDPKVGVYMARLLFPGLLGLWAWGAYRARRRWFAVILGLLAATAVFLSGERMAFIFVLFGLFLTALAWFGVRRAAVLALVGAAVLSAMFFAGRGNEAIQRQFVSTAQEFAGVWNSPYGHLWRSGVKVGSARPLTGVGMHNFRVACSIPGIGMPPSFDYRCNLHPHNMYIEWFSESGIPGLLGFVTLVGVWLRRVWRAGRRSGWPGWLLGPAVGVFVYLWPLAPTHGFFSNWNAVTFWLLLGWALAAARIADRGGSLFDESAGPSEKPAQPEAA
ncbi:MAG TPA: O-antigen ligase family protein [Gammaproteobacteria bacterium]|nr:O-antigen ligase family protein [Gammaproteobacteria bacterium]